MISSAADLVLAAYMFAAIMFILALRGLNRPESSKAGNFYGAASPVVGSVVHLMRTIA